MLAGTIPEAVIILPICLTIMTSVCVIITKRNNKTCSVTFNGGTVSTYPIASIDV